MADVFPGPGAMRLGALLVLAAALALHAWAHRAQRPRWLLTLGCALSLGVVFPVLGDAMGRRLVETHGPLVPAAAWLWFVVPSLVFLGAAVVASFLDRPLAWIALAVGSAVGAVALIAARSGSELTEDALISLAALALPLAVAALARRPGAAPKLGAVALGLVLSVAGTGGALLGVATSDRFPAQGERLWRLTVAPEGDAPWNLTLPFVTAAPDLAPVMEAWRARMGVESGQAAFAFGPGNSTLRIEGRGPAVVAADYHYYGPSEQMEGPSQYAYGAPDAAIQGANATLTWTVVLGAGLGGCGGEDGGTLHLVAGQPQPFTPDAHGGPRAMPCV